jgi:uncharacterized membrane protein
MMNSWKMPAPYFDLSLLMVKAMLLAQMVQRWMV